MSEELSQLIQAARQLAEGEILLGGADFLPRQRNPLPAPALAPAAAPSAPATSPLHQAPHAAPARAAAVQPIESTPMAARKLPCSVDMSDLGETPDGAAMSADQKCQSLDALRQRVLQCMQCSLGKTRTNLVFGEGDPAARLVFVGEAPGADEDASGRPFVGRAGQKLTEMIGAMGLSREQVYICNVLKCRPPGNRPPAPEEVNFCWPFLLRQLQIIHPDVIVTLGNPATQNLLQTQTGITKLRGHWQKLPNLAPGLEGIDVMPTFHPSYIIRTYTLEVRKMAWHDLQLVMERLGLKK